MFEQRHSSNQLHAFLLCLACSVVLLALLITLDYQVHHRPLLGRELRVVLDSVAHAANAAFLFLPCALLDRRAAGYVIAAAVIGSAIDVDHFIAAGSLSIDDAIHLGARPPAHSLTFAFLFGIVGFFVTRSPVWAAVASLSVISHVLRDASDSSTRLFYPFPPAVHVPLSMYYAAECGLVFVSSYGIWLMNRWNPRTDSGPQHGPDL